MNIQQVSSSTVLLLAQNVAPARPTNIASTRVTITSGLQQQILTLLLLFLTLVQTREGQKSSCASHSKSAVIFYVRNEVLVTLTGSVYRARQ